MTVIQNDMIRFIAIKLKLFNYVSAFIAHMLIRED